MEESNLTFPMIVITPESNNQDYLKPDPEPEDPVNDESHRTDPQPVSFRGHRHRPATSSRSTQDAMDQQPMGTQNLEIIGTELGSQGSTEVLRSILLEPDVHIESEQERRGIECSVSDINNNGTANIKLEFDTDHQVVENGDKQSKKSAATKNRKDNSGVMTRPESTAKVKLEFRCEACGKSCPTRKMLTQHTKSHLLTKECIVCGEWFQDIHKLKVHHRMHTDERPFTCKICNAAFKMKQHLQQHERSHTGDKPFACDVCEKSFGSHSNMCLHKRTQHSDNKPFECSVCKKTFARKDKLKRHINVHSEGMSLQCDLCTRVFKTPQTLKRHKKMHADDDMKPFSCLFCKKRFLAKKTLDAHIYNRNKKSPADRICITGDNVELWRSTCIKSEKETKIKRKK